MFGMTVPPPPPSGGESHDGKGAGDHDQPYVFGRQPTVSAPFPFTTRDFAHLQLLRGRVQDARANLDAETAQDLEPAAWPAEPEPEPETPAE
jgi:hypothetical protein